MRVRLLLCLSLLLSTLVTSAADKPLTNEEVIALVKAGLSENVVVAKVKQVPTVSFDLSTEGLIELKKQSVPQNVITAMLERDTKPSAQPLSDTSAGSWTVRLVTSTGPIDLAKMQGAADNSFLRMGATSYNNFAGAKAKTRVPVGDLQILVATAGQPNGQFFLVKVDSVAKKNLRSVKVGHGFYGMKDSNSPDPDWTIPYDAEETTKGVWRLNLGKQLTPGEYGVFVASSNLLGTGELYDFGVD